MRESFSMKNIICNLFQTCYPRNETEDSIELLEEEGVDK